LGHFDTVLGAKVDGKSIFERQTQEKEKRKMKKDRKKRDRHEKGEKINNEQ